jgi:hypothetical protein
LRLRQLLPVSIASINLNRELTFKVYTCRWGHYDYYKVERKTKGWYVSHIAINGLSEKDGTGALLMNLDHDSVFYPENGVKYALETLWKLADETEMEVSDLQDKLQQIAD